MGIWAQHAPEDYGTSNATVAGFSAARLSHQGLVAGKPFGSSIGIPAKLGEEQHIGSNFRPDWPGASAALLDFLCAKLHRHPGPDFAGYGCSGGPVRFGGNADWAAAASAPGPFLGNCHLGNDSLSGCLRSTGWLAEVDSLPGWLSVVASSAAQTPIPRWDRWIPAFGQLGDGGLRPAAILLWGSGTGHLGGSGVGFGGSDAGVQLSAQSKSVWGLLDPGHSSGAGRHLDLAQLGGRNSWPGLRRR